MGQLYPMGQLTPGQQNTGPRVGPVIISEVMYHPPETGHGIDVRDLEFIEIYNSADTVLDTPNWTVRGGVDFDFPTEYGFPIPDHIPGRIGLAANETLVLVRFDPARQADKLRQFREYYSIEQSVRIAGPFDGSFGNATDTVRLLRPDYPPAWEPHHWPSVLEDEVSYEDSSPWPATTDGLGDSLQRRRVDLWGNDATSWLALAPRRVPST